MSEGLLTQLSLAKEQSIRASRVDSVATMARDQ